MKAMRRIEVVVAALTLVQVATSGVANAVTPTRHPAAPRAGRGQPDAASGVSGGSLPGNLQELGFAAALPVCGNVGSLAGPIVNPANTHRYYLLQNASWPESEAQAVCLGGHLATINDEAEQNWVWSEFSRYGGVDRSIWIGLTDEALEGNFVWSSGEPLQYTHWNSNEPNNAGNEDYVHLRWIADGRWNDIAGTETSGDGVPLHGVVEVRDCGNGGLDPGEECDDGNTKPSDGCTNTCTICGNGAITPPERCDDGNLIDHDGCNADCQLPVCGDGVVDPGEQCDDSNRIPDDGCTDHCTICGNGIVTPPEECDDGNRDPNDGCSNSCTARWVLSGSLGGPQGEPRAISVDPSSPDMLYVAFAGSGVHKSIDAGRTWLAAKTGLPTRDANVLALDPLSPRTLYAGFDEEGVFKTTDGGSTWLAANSGLPSNPAAKALAPDPVISGMLYAGIDRYGVYKSIDGGAHWRPASAGLTAKAVRALAVSPSTHTTLYVGTENGGVYRSRDAAQSWQVVNTGLEDLAVRALAIDPTNAAVVYAGTNRAVFKTNDAGVHWAPAVNGLPEVAVNALVIDPTMADTVYAATEGDGVFQSADGGLTWYAANTGLSDRTVRALVIDPTMPETLYAGTPTGLHASTMSENWQLIAGGDTTAAAAVVVDPIMPDRLYAAANSRSGRSGTVFKSEDRGATWTSAGVGLSGVPLDDLVMDARNPSILYAALSDLDDQSPWLGGVYKTNDGALSWHRASDGLPAAQLDGDVNVGRLTKIGVDPTTPDTLYLGYFGQGIFKSTDGAGSWQPVNTGITSLYPWDFGFDPSAPGTVYVGTAAPLFKTTDGAAVWQRLPRDPEGVTAVAVDPVDPRIVYTAGNDAVHKSTDGGEHSASANAGLPQIGYNVIAIDPVRDDTVYVAVYFNNPAVYRSNDGGRSWSGFGDGLDVYSAHTLTIDPSNPGRLYAGTDLGVFKIEQTIAFACAGDCDGSGAVTVDELITMVNIALGSAQLTDCAAGDANRNGAITIDEIIGAVNAALGGCL